MSAQYGRSFFGDNMKAGDINFIHAQAQYTRTINMSFREKRMKRFVNYVEGNLSKILFYSLILSLLGYFFR